MKQIGILGTGAVGRTIGTRLIELGYDVKMGSRTADNPKAGEWANTNSPRATQGTFADAASFGEIVFNCTKGEHSLSAVQLAGADHLANKILIDLANPLDFSNGMPPTLIPSLVNTHSLGEAIQHALPDTRVVKTLNMVNCEVMVDASKCGGDATMLLAGNDAQALDESSAILNQFGWTDLIRLGGIAHARGMEMMLPVWLSVYMSSGDGYIGFKIVRNA